LGRMAQLADEEVMRINMDRKHNGPYALGLTRKPYYRENSWDADSYQDVYLINMDNGERKLILKKLQSSAYLSPLGRYIAYYDEPDSSWNSFSVKSGEFNKLTDNIPVCFSYEEFDMPTTPGPYGVMGWTKNDDNLLVYDRYDIWMLDPDGNDEPVRLTQGRKDETRFRYIKLDPEEEFIPEKEKLLLRAFNENNKDAGFSTMNLSNKPELESIQMAPYRFYTPKKAEEADKIIWQRMNFKEYPDLYISNMDFSGEKRLTDVNPRQEDYLWGRVEMVHWTSADGVDLDGLLYKPENFSPDSSYPMIVYFYEKYSNGLHNHYTPKPSRSTVNFTYYVSNGYLIFVPDIVYKTGFPGQSAYNSVVSGTLQLMQNPWVDKEHIGIQGQSWGGYQVAYLITQTDMFAAAMAGAPVSNMTSAYGGIRWGSGMSRMFQYEGSQSRIGGTLWEMPWRYIENSPIFFADKVETPLLMMHNDKDGAVPWYQGIEYFVALRRLDKPVWMLTYNGAPHNLKRRADCKDLSIRMQQFFDHYLKGAPAPVWMEYGIPAVDKGKDRGYELVE
ncbi:MAG: S9 family peptidase, partial [Bacteroidales bacterium]|nr:S9 family peptidase [Bacteroidales bacterium]